MTAPIAALPAAGGARPRNLIAMGTAFLCAGATMFFAALFASYIELRSHAAEWPPEGVKLDNYLGNMLVITMLLGVLTVLWSVSAIKRAERRQAAVALGITIGLGVAFVNLLSYTISQQDLSITSTPYATIVGAMAVLVGIVVGVAIGFVILTMLRVSGSQVRADEPDLVRATACFWVFATLATIVVWFAVVILK
jgi:heme/copper-type cytochrome/quinol oxidase subunit 3